MEAPWTEVADLAARNGLALEVRPAHDGTIGVFISRAEDYGDWSLAPTKIAWGRDPLAVASVARRAISDMTPRLQKALDKASPYPPDDPDDRIAVALERIADALEAHAAALARRSRPDRTGAGSADTDGGVVS